MPKSVQRRQGWYNSGGTFTKLYPYIFLHYSCKLVWKECRDEALYINLHHYYHPCLVYNHRESQELQLYLSCSSLFYFIVHFFIFCRQQITQIGSSFQGSTQQFREALDQINWNSDTVQGLQQAVLNGPQVTFCVTNDSVSDRIRRYKIRSWSSFEADQVHVQITSMQWFWVRVVYSSIL